MENDIFKQLLDTVSDMATKMKSIADKVDQLQPGGGGGSASIADYQPNQKYKRNTLLVDPTTETVYQMHHHHRCHICMMKIMVFLHLLRH